MKGTNGKKAALLLALLLVTALCAGCGESEKQPNPGEETKDVPVIISQAEYLLYQNIFYNDYGPQYNGTEVTKQGVLTTIYDAFNGKNRYYVWGYLDNTKCCDWQWEIQPADNKSLPPNGSVVMVKGVFAASDDSLDGYWITDAAVAQLTRYGGEQAELNMRTMSDTLERVQMLNILYRPEAFEGKGFSAYGRVLNAQTLQDPYYDGSWQMPMSVSSSLPAIGATVALRGTVKDGVLSAQEITVLD